MSISFSTPKEEELLSPLSTDLQAFLNPQSKQPLTWEVLWSFSKRFFQARRFLHLDNQEFLALFTEAEAKLQKDSTALLAELSNAHLQEHLQTATNGLQYEMEQTIGNTSLSHRESLEQLEKLQDFLDALQWLSEQCPPLSQSAHIAAETIADLSLLEREIQNVSEDVKAEQLRTQSKAQDQEDPLHETVEIRKQAEQLRQKCAQLYGKLVAQEMHDFLEQTEQKEDSKETKPESLGRLWLWLQHGEELQLAFQREKLRRKTYINGRLEQLCKQTNQQCQNIREQFQQSSATLPNEEVREWWSKNLRFLLDDIDDQLATLDDQGIPLALQQLKRIAGQTEWIGGMVEPLTKAEPSSNPDTEKDFQSAVKQLERIRYRVKVEQQERKLQSKLEERFGLQFMRRSENTVLVLILLVLVFLIIEVSFTLSPSMKNAFMWADTVICLFFLLEFGTKLTFSESRWFYFRRHFLIDLLPAIPFGFIFWFFQSSSVLANLTAGRAVRLVRISQFARYIRIIRPLIRIFRLFSFMVKAIGGVLRKYETLFNRNIIIFPSPEEGYVPHQQRIRYKFQQLRQRCRRRFQMHLNQMSLPDKIVYMESQLSHLNDSMNRFPSTQPLFTQNNRATDVVYLPKLINRMIRIDAIEVEEVLGRGFVDQSYRILSYLSLPFVGSIPGLRKFAKVYKHQDPAALLAYVIRSWGRLLQKVQAAIHWFGDLYGIVTGPQVLDRLGTTMVNATLRPARRLLLFGFFFLFLSGLIYAFSIDSLKGAAAFLAKFLGTPIIVLGSISLIPLVLGFWFRRIASASSDFFGRVAEAQFIGHLKQVKRHKAKADLEHLLQRVLRPEALLRDKPYTDNQKLVGELLEHLQDIGELEEYSEVSTQRQVTPPNEAKEEFKSTLSKTRSARYMDRERMLTLYEDYLGGSPLHRSDTLTTNQLLGNITIQNIRRHRLSLSLFDNMRIDRLDLSRPRLFHFLGPYLWFTAITESLSHRVARLIVEYNKNCITLTEMRWQSEESSKLYEEWLVQREERIHGKIPPAGSTNEQNLEFRTTAFTALHFLSTNKDRDDAILETFGARVLRLVQNERRLLFRELFGFYPFHELPKEMRTVNIYQLYLNHLSGGKFFLFPFKVLLWLFRFFVWTFRRVRQLVKDVLKPPSEDDAARSGHAPFEVAIRKINRMRKPIYMEYMRLRARLDVEYLGLFLSGTASSGLEGQTFEADLNFITASEQERLEFDQLHIDRTQQLRLFDKFLRRYSWKGEQLRSYLQEIDPALGQQWRSVLRAITSAYAANYHQIRSLLEAEEALNALLEEGSNLTQAVGLRGRWWAHTKRFFSRTLLLQSDREYENFQKAWKRSTFAEKGDDAMRSCWLLYLSRRKQMMPLLELATEQKETPSERVYEELSQVIRNSSIWTEELLTLRTLQTITRLDLRLYRELVYTLGDYHEPGAIEDTPLAKD